MDLKEHPNDPAEYLKNETIFHDCYLTVGNPTFEQVEKVAVHKANLVAHSSVFRDMLLESELADPTGEKTHITDVSPEIFKLMLKHVNGSRGFLKSVPKEDLLKLALCADKYNIPVLVQKACKRLIPTCVEEVFLALQCVVYVKCPLLQPAVEKIVQEQTTAVVKNKAFIDLDVHCIEFILKQPTLQISELELWKITLTWAENKLVSEQSSLRQLLHVPLQHIRLASLSEQEIINNFLTSKVLTHEESTELLLAVANKKVLNLPGLCSLKDIRAVPQFELIRNSWSSDQWPHIDKRNYKCTRVQQDLEETSSNLSIQTEKDIILESLIVRSRSLKKNGNPIYDLKCDIGIFKIEGGSCTSKSNVTVNKSVVCDEDVEIPINTRNNPVRLLANSSYKLYLKYALPHTVFIRTRDSHDVTSEMRSIPGMRVKFNTSLHILKINYQYYLNERK